MQSCMEGVEIDRIISRFEKTRSLIVSTLNYVRRDPGQIHSQSSHPCGSICAILKYAPFLGAKRTRIPRLTWIKPCFAVYLT